MAKSTYSAPVSQVYGEGTSGAGIDLATTIAYGDIVNVRKGFKGLQIYCASAINVLTTPRIDKVLLWDASADVWTDYTLKALDNSESTFVNLSSMATADILYVGCVDTYLGLSVNVGTANSTATTFDEEYSSPGGDWTNLPATISDGTLDGTKTLGQDGLYTWGLPSNWVPVSVHDSVPLYFTSFKPGSALSANTSIYELVAINKGTNYAYFPAAMAQEFNYDEDKVGGLQFLAVSGTPTVYVNWIEYKG